VIRAVAASLREVSGGRVGCSDNSSVVDDGASAHEEGLALFIEPAWRARFLGSLDDRRRREKLLGKLHHFRHLDSRFLEAVPRAQQRSEFLLPTLRSYGAPRRCYLVSNDGALDRSELSLADALGQIVDADSFLATFVSCLPGKLAYFQDEEQGNRWILRRQD
jgi:hypothetical protein